jgi:hypothetical protein
MAEKERIFVKAFNKYLDELTVEEWESMNNATCDDPLKECDNVMIQVIEEQENKK